MKKVYTNFMSDKFVVENSKISENQTNLVT